MGIIRPKGKRVSDYVCASSRPAIHAKEKKKKKKKEKEKVAQKQRESKVQRCTWKSCKICSPPKNHFPNPSWSSLSSCESVVRVRISSSQALVDLEHSEDVADIASRVIAGFQVLTGALLARVDDDLAPVFWNGTAGCGTAPLGDVIGRDGELRPIFGGWRC
jgi:hypothetical protein